MEESGITPEREAELVYGSMTRRARRNVKRIKQKHTDIPDLMRGMSNHQRMMVKKIARSGRETKSRAQRSK